MKRVNRVAIGGIGLVNSQSIGIEEFCKNSGCIPSFRIDEDSFSGSNSKIALSKVGQIDIGKYLPGISIKYIDKTTIYTGISTKMALGSHIDDNTLDASETGMALGTAMGSIVSITNFDLKALNEGPNAVSPMEFPNTVSNAPGSRIGIWFKLKGPSITVSNGFTSSMDAIGYAFNEISYGDARYYLAGGSEELSDNLYRGYSKVVMGKAPSFKQDNVTEILGEGSGIMLLYSMEDAVSMNCDTEVEIVDFFTSKIPIDVNSVDTIKNIINRILDENFMLKSQTVIYTSYLPFNELSCKVYEELQKNLGKGRIIAVNQIDNTYMNYMGCNGVFNTAYAVNDIKNRNDKIKGALVLDTGCDGKLSFIVIKCCS